MMRAYVWFEGRRVGDFKDVISVECDGDIVEVHTGDDEVETYSEGEWDDVAVHEAS